MFKRYFNVMTFNSLQARILHSCVNQYGICLRIGNRAILITRKSKQA